MSTSSLSDTSSTRGWDILAAVVVEVKSWGVVWFAEEECGGSWFGGRRSIVGFLGRFKVWSVRANGGVGAGLAKL